jgi:hypothetical protein
VGLRGDLRVKDNLQQAGTVSQVNENQAAVVPPPVHPACNGDFVASVWLARLPAVGVLVQRIALSERMN